MNDRILDLLYRALDGELTDEEQQQLTSALESSAELSAERDQLMQMRGMVQANAVRSFRPFFSTRVMRRLQPSQRHADGFWSALTRSFRLVAATGVAVVVLLLVSTALTANDLSLSTLLGLPEATLEQTWQMDYLEEINR